MLKIALLALTMSSDGELRMQVHETNGWAECAMQYERTKELFRATGVQAIETLCGEHDLPLTKSALVPNPLDQPQRYRVMIAQNGHFRIDPLGERQVCTSSNDWPNRVYCAWSDQTVDLDRYARF